MDIISLVKYIKLRPLMYVKEERLDYIFYLLLGTCSECKRNNEDDLNSNFIMWFGKWLELWMESNSYEMNKYFWWYEDVISISKDQKDACRLFYELFEMFIEDYNNKIGYFEWRNDNRYDI